MSKHWVGEPSDEYRAVCLYSPCPEDPDCGAPAAVHVITIAYGELAGLPACPEHAPIARVAGEFLAEHDHAGICGLPGPVWLPDANMCVIDDSGIESVLAATVDLVMENAS